MIRSSRDPHNQTPSEAPHSAFDVRVASSPDILQEWYRRIMPSQVYWCRWSDPMIWRRLDWRRRVSLINRLSRRYLKELVQILHEVKTDGRLIRRHYGVSLYSQIRKQVILVFRIGVPHRHYKRYHLFKRDRWKRATEYL